MGRIFEKRKHKMFARYDKMAKAFTKIGKEIAIAVKAGGADPANNPRLRQVIANAKGVNMPKDRIEGAIKRASAKDASSFEEVVYEGYGPFGVGILVETATDNPTRTVANIRLYFNRNEGTLGTSGSLSFLFDRKGVFRIAAGQIADIEELELELIDSGLESIEKDDDANQVVIYTDYTDFGNMQKALEERNILSTQAGLERIPNSYAEVSEEQMDKVLELIDKIEEDDDVQAVYHNLR
jgi:YebC/PmpR family DNA-binding regulatory protein